MCWFLTHGGFSNSRSSLGSDCFALLGPCAGCSNRPVRSLTKTRRRRRATGRFTKRGIRQARRPPLAKCVGIDHSPAATARRREDRAPFASLSGRFENQHRKQRREDAHIKRRGVEVRGLPPRPRARRRDQPAPLASFFLLLPLPSLLSSSLPSPIPSFSSPYILYSFLSLSFSLVSSPPFLQVLLSSNTCFVLFYTEPNFSRTSNTRGSWNNSKNRVPGDF